MQILNLEDAIIFKFGSLKKLIINRKEKVIEYWDGKIPFSNVHGYWKNYHPKRLGMVYYVMVLTSKKIHKITPEIKDEEVVDIIIKNLENFIPLEVKE